jgi:hypothetical protein
MASMLGHPGMIYKAWFVKGIHIWMTWKIW